MKKIAQQHIPIGEVYSSPTCRTKEMAELIFGKHFGIRREIVYKWMYKNTVEKDALNIKLRKILGTPPPPGTNRVLLAHGNVLRVDLVGFAVDLTEGSAAILKPLGGSKYKLVKKITIGKWRKP